MTLYTGTTARIVGISWGLLLTTAGVAGAIMTAAILASVIQVSWLLIIWTGIFAAVGLLFGPLLIKDALTEPEYTFRVTDHSGSSTKTFEIGGDGGE